MKGLSKLIIKSASVLLYAVLLISFSCSTARDRNTEKHLLASASVFENDTQIYLKANLKSGDIYYNYEPVLNADALQRTPEYIKYWAADPQRNAFQTDAEREEFIKRETESISGYQSFIVSFHNPGKGEFRADKSKELNIFLQYKTGDGTNKIYPADIRRLKNDHEEVRYLQKYLVSFDRFSEVYLISFPQTDLNANTALPEQTSDSAADKALNLVISHLKGYTIISFT